MGMGGSNKAQEQANQNEAQTQANIKAAQSSINAIYNDPSRQAQYDKLTADTTKYYTDDVNRQEAVNARKLKFAMARAGLAGGSEQAYQGQVLGQDYNKALIAASRAGQSAGANLRNADEQSRMNLLAMAQSGLDSGTASQQATESLQNNLLSGESTATAQSLGDAFGDFSQIYQSSQDAAALRKGQLYGYGSVFSPMYGQGASQGGYNYGP